MNDYSFFRETLMDNLSKERLINVKDSTSIRIDPFILVYPIDYRHFLAVIGK